MKGCKPGDVILAPFKLGSSAYPRPLVILSVTAEGELHVCPITSRHPSGKPALNCSFTDFLNGGLDLFEESYILAHETGIIQEKSIRHKKGTLEPEYFRTLLDIVHSCR